MYVQAYFSWLHTKVLYNTYRYISGFARWSREELRCKKPTQRCTDFNGKVYKEKKKDKIGKNINCINLKKIWNYILKAL